MKSLQNVFLLLVIVCCTACGGSKKAATGDGLVLYNLVGNEPYWNVKVAPTGITFETLGEDPFVYPYVEAQKVGGYTVYQTDKKQSKIRVAISEKGCTDSMSGEKYPYTARVEKDGQVYTGCAR